MTDQDPLDDRLRSYLRERADVPTPDGLLESVRASARPAPHVWRSWPRVAFAVVAVMVAVVIIGTRVLPVENQGGTPRLSTQGQPSSGVTPSSSSTPRDSGLAANGFPAEALGLPVISVDEARTLIAGRQHQGRAMAVGGWWSEAILGMGCPAPMVFKSVVEGYCSLTALAPTDAKIDDYQSSANSSSESFRAPPNALLPREGPETAGVDEPWKGVAFGSAQRMLPQRVVLIGHVGDPRAWMCAAETFRSCQSEFVVDAFAWVEGRIIDSWKDNGGAPGNLTVDQARSAVAGAVPESRTVTLSASTADEIAYLDPRISLDAGTFWLARVVAGPLDPEGTSELVEVLIDDRTGTAQTLPMRFAAGTEPGAVQFVANGDFFNGFGQLPTLYAAIVDGAGRRLRQAFLGPYSNTPAVLPEGDYAVVSWSGDPNSRVANPSQPPQVGCSRSVHVVSNAIVSVTVSWDAQQTCKIGPGPATPTASP
jgi:hypothetical protein